MWLRKFMASCYCRAIEAAITLAVLMFLLHGCFPE